MGVSLLAQPPSGVNQLPPIPGQSVVLNWTDPVNPAGTTYNVYSLAGNCPGTSLLGPPIQTGITSTSFIFAALTPGTYCWAVTAVGPGGESPQSNQTSVALPVGKYDDLGVGAGIQKSGGGLQPVTLSIDNTVTAFVNVGPTLPATCGTSNSVFFQTYTNPASQITIFSIWFCGPNGKFQKPLLYKQS
jgi:hypothetical protein